MWKLADKTLTSRMLLGTALYPSMQTMQDSIRASGTELITIALRRQNPKEKSGEVFWNHLKNSGCHILPNTAGCRSAHEAVMVAELSRELFNTNWVKLEVFGDDYNLQPDPFELLIATKILVEKGFEVFPYCTEDLVLCQRLVDAGCRILMPWGAPIGSGRGLLNPYALETLRARLPHTTLIVDAGIGKPSDAVSAMELGFDGILLNSAIALAIDPVQMAVAFQHAWQAGRLAYESGIMAQRNMAHPSTPLPDTLFWEREPFKENLEA